MDADRMNEAEQSMTLSQLYDALSDLMNTRAVVDAAAGEDPLLVDAAYRALVSGGLWVGDRQRWDREREQFTQTRLALRAAQEAWARDNLTAADPVDRETARRIMREVQETLATEAVRSGLTPGGSCRDDHWPPTPGGLPFERRGVDDG